MPGMWGNHDADCDDGAQRRHQAFHPWAVKAEQEIDLQMALLPGGNAEAEKDVKNAQIQRQLLTPGLRVGKDISHAGILAAAFTRFINANSEIPRLNIHRNFSNSLCDDPVCFFKNTKSLLYDPE